MEFQVFFFFFPIFYTVFFFFFPYYISLPLLQFRNQKIIIQSRGLKMYRLAFGDLINLTPFQIVT